MYLTLVFSSISHPGNPTNNDSPPPPLSVLQATIAGTLTGMTETILHTPFEVLKTRLQSREWKHCSNTYTCAQELWLKEGPGAFYRGFEAYLWRQGVWNGCFFGTIAWVRESFPFAPPPPPPLSPPPASTGGAMANEENAHTHNTTHTQTRRMYDFWTGLTAGFLATLVNTPLDVCKTRIQCMTTYTHTHTHTPIIPWCFPLLRLIYVDEGFRACFKGLDARLMRAAPGSGILLVAYQSISDLLTRE
jgi:solute carrier family 25 2-oxodicarboxylate transporter 21